jgi:protein TonB
MHPRHPQPNLVLKRPAAFLAEPPPDPTTLPPSRRLAPALLLALVAHVLVGMQVARVRFDAARSAPAGGTPVAVSLGATETWSPVVDSVNNRGARLADTDADQDAPAFPELPSIANLPLPPEQPIRLPALEPKFEVVPAAVIAITGPSLGSWVIEQAAADPSAVETGAPSVNIASTGGAGPATGGGSQPGLGDQGGTGGGIGNGPAGLPVYLRQPRPRYPMLARQQGWQGTALLRLEVRPDGRAGAVELVQSSGHEILDHAAIEAARNARFKNATNAWVEVPITFRLNQD